jgi:C1A family cysteine protease
MKSANLFINTLIGLFTLQSCNLGAQTENPSDFPLTTGINSTGDGVDLRPLMTKVKDQGQRDTCNAFAATSLMEFLVKRETGEDIDLSEAYNYWAAKKYVLTTKYLQDTYKNIDGLAGFLAVEAYKTGSMAEKAWPYEPLNWFSTGDPRCKSVGSKPATECFTGVPPQGAKNLPYKIKPIYIERERIADFILKEKKPVIVNLTWNFDAVSAAGDVRLPAPAELKKSGGHVITLVGYNSGTKRFIFRNSYGENWGNKGYGTIPEEYIIKYCEVCPYIPNMASYSPDVKDMVLKTSMGVSGELAR